MIASIVRDIPHTQGRSVAMPLGGIGTGNVAICADGALRQWQLHNLGNHRGDLPGSFFAVRVSQWEPPLDVVRVLQAPPDADRTQPSTPMVDDDLVPAWQRDLVANGGGVQGTVFRGTYPVAEIDYHDDNLPIAITLTSLTPLVPLDVDASSLPAAMFTFSVTNTAPVGVHGWLGAAAQNPVGHDGATNPVGVQAPGYGGNTNRIHRDTAWSSLVMENHAIDSLAPGAGQFVLGADSPVARAFPQWTHPQQFLEFLRGLSRPGDGDPPPASGDGMPQVGRHLSTTRPSPPGATWNGGIAAPFTLKPGETARIRVLMTWHFPNRYVNFPQFGPPAPEWGPTRFWLGNRYSRDPSDALASAARVVEEWDELSARTWRWARTLRESGLGAEAAEHFAAQAVPIRTPTCFRSEDGTFFGFEGVLGASTRMWSGDVGGSCPLNCTHVWNYAQAPARLFPSLERNMRDTELRIAQAPDGSIPHRVIVPTYLRQLWDRPIGGPLEPALDGMLGTILKCYREVRNGAGRSWLEGVWPDLVRLLTHVRMNWDPESTGVLRGIQPSTHDIDLCGVNPFMGSLWLAALRAAQRLADILGESMLVEELEPLFQRGSDEYDRLLFNGEYYEQLLEDGDSAEYQWGSGCLSDQLIGQWWAHQLDLGWIFPSEHVRTSLRSIVRYNLRDGFEDDQHPFRSFAVEEERGLVLCSWPRGGRPAVPVRYADEVWTGTEYQVAGHCLQEGLADEADAILSALWGRYDGQRRNPYNHVECGDHYVRSMSGWAALEAWTGQRWNALTGQLRMRRPPKGCSWPVLLDGGWGELADVGDVLELRCHEGSFALQSLRLIAPGTPPSYDREDEPGEDSHEALSGPVSVEAGEVLRMLQQPG